MEIFRTQFQLLRLLGHPRRNSNIAHKVLSFYNPIALIGFSSTILKFTVKHFSEIELATEATAPLFTGILSVIKMVTCLWRKERIFQIIDHLKNLGKTDKADTERDIIQTANKRDNILTLSYLAACLMTVVYFVFTPIMKAIVELVLKGQRNPSWTTPMPSS
jgi:7tm Odorant receptor